ncbi:hypothetical protein MNBD_UNCLBAC01-1038 [hydrothermal vent metagenome]|uniref:Na(+) H(+) antiporter subunit E n=1 Tax=hydrothermal vent metagenome TaxID=652676 RepID=A0A3B1D7I3_9ZZZZ
MVWWILTGGALSSWIIGVPAIVLSLMMSRILPPLPSFHLNIRGAFHFLIFFIQQSILSGFDVAKRVVHPDCPLDPCLIKYKIRISNGSARIVFTNTISLLPGTLSVDLLDEDVLVHVLDKKDPILDNLQVLEIKIAALFGENL